MNSIKWDQIITQISELEYPVLFFFKLIINKNLLNDYHMGLIVSNFFKFHFKLAINYPLFYLTKDLKENHIYTWKIINNFYNSIIYIIQISPNINKFKNSVNKLKYYEFSVENILKKTKLLLNIVKSNFDSNYSNTPFYLRYHMLMKSNKHDKVTHDQLVNRLINVYKLLGIKFFNLYNIKLLTLEEFNSLTIKERVKYSAYFYNLTKSILQNNIRYLELLLFHKQRITNIVNPKIIDIETKYTSSETDFEELCYF
tara:strand:+ start:622 stop:1389 length:768 start_codon:yes stop_codon:yes gene_type:complete